MSAPAILDLPVSVTLALWLPTVHDRDTALRAVRAVTRVDEHHEVRSRTGEGAPRTGTPPALREMVATLAPVHEVAAVLPRSGDPMGTPAVRSTDLLDAGEGLLLRRRDGRGTEVCTIVVPLRQTYGSVYERGELVTWTVDEDVTDLIPAPSLLLAGVDSLSQARREIQLAMTEAVEALEDLDVARHRPDVADQLLDLSLATLPDRLLPPGLDRRRLDVLERAARLLAIVALAVADDGAAVTATQTYRRSGALAQVERAARHAMCAASATRP
ncbi:MAG: hypothetical protein ACYC1Z_08415 [Georgenia sp.]